MKKREYAYKILIAVILLKIGAGATASVISNFVNPVVSDFGWMVSQFTMITSIQAIGMALFYTIAAKVLVRGKIGLIMGCAALAESLAVFLMGTYRNLYMFYISAAVIGISQAFTGYVAVPVLLNMWFKKDYGTVFGTVMGVNSASSVIFNLLSGYLITNFGWRTSYFILGIIAFVTMVPAIFLFVRTPEEIGEKPYGYTESNEIQSAGAEWGLTLKEAFKKTAFWLAWFTCICYSIGSCANGYIVPYTTMELGKSVNYGAIVGVFYSLGAILCSLILGRLNDKYGVKSGLVYGAVTSFIGFGLLVYAKQMPSITPFASFITGLGSCMYTVQCPLLAKKVIGDKYYSDVWSVMMTANSLIGGGLFSSFALFYDIGGSYHGAFITGAGLFVLAMITGSLSIKEADKYKTLNN